MTPEAVLIAKPDIDFATFIRLSNQALGYSPARAADKTNRELTDTEKFLSCLAAFRDRVAPVGLAPNLLAHVSFTMLIVADDEDMVLILEMAAGMPWVIANTVKPGVQIAILSGDLADWRDAVKSGTAKGSSPAVRLFYSKALMIFERCGLTAIWNDCQKKTAPDNSGFFLEDKRR